MLESPFHILNAIEWIMAIMPSPLLCSYFWPQKPSKCDITTQKIPTYCIVYYMYDECAGPSISMIRSNDFSLSFPVCVCADVMKCKSPNHFCLFKALILFGENKLQPFQHITSGALCRAQHNTHFVAAGMVDADQNKQQKWWEKPNTKRKILATLL